MKNINELQKEFKIELPDRKELKKIQEKRFILKQLSRIANQYHRKDTNVEIAFALIKVNDRLRHYIYQCQNIKTFQEWRECGRTVKKGEKALLFWGTPIKRKLKDKEGKIIKDKEGNPKKGKDYFPLVYLFSEEQTEPM